MLYEVVYGTRKGAVYHESRRVFASTRSMLRFLKMILDDEDMNEYPKYHLLQVHKSPEKGHNQ